MLDPKIVELASERIRIEVEDLNKRLSEEIAQSASKAAARGRFYSSPHVLEIFKLCKVNIHNKAQLIWIILHRFITTAGVSHSEDISDELKKIVINHLSRNFEKDTFRGKIPKLHGSPREYDNLESDLDGEREKAIRKISTEIDLFAESLKSKESKSGDKSSSTILNIYSPVGSIQTGPNSTAYVTQNIDTEAREKILTALNSVEEAIRDIASLPYHPKDEILELIHEGKSEVGKSKPNTTKIRTLLQTIAVSIQTVGSLQPAYEGLKLALTPLGITLP